MLTVTKLAKTCGISRAAVLYYEREGLLKPKLRSENGYRWYGDTELQRLKEILRFRSFGIPVADITALVEHNDKETQSEMLKAQFNILEQNISELRKQQSAIVALLKQPELLEQGMVTKERWVEIMRASGFTEQDMTKWHQNFEKMEPQEHQKFLESLGIEAEEISRIRNF
ncbi:MerR family transcriptional regulator [Thalassotalea euphylliae]|uniref:MerR family transcriptional regulator n=1 Tax=Thalassotalea euphylliae TaxID=1655234 RepID=A0A3E0UK73_9GAMM|nr:MerR family transcriptional regulator [Thalassotalea euphylliae]REL37388.1 MerR family transcriptional regulator [Thalassotalea euphylliae]